jgi:UDP-N-acetylglucosamine 1-carboxyvinyltransferase
MVIAGLAAEGVTTIEEVEYIERGYENLIGKLRDLGADIRAIDPPEPNTMASVV